MPERQLVHIAVGAASQHLIASFANMDLAQGRSRVPSLYALEIARAVEGRIPRLQTFELESQAKAEARLTWPAPQDPLRSIDDGEYDLSWYWRHAEDPGSCTYLKEANQYLYRSLRTRYERWERKWTSSDGMVSIDLIEPFTPLRVCSILPHVHTVSTCMEFTG
jgi:hypothetical protein